MLLSIRRQAEEYNNFPMYSEGCSKIKMSLVSARNFQSVHAITLMYNDINVNFVTKKGILKCVINNPKAVWFLHLYIVTQ